jgi:predicted O-methyltransferase YrrM
MYKDKQIEKDLIRNIFDSESEYNSYQKEAIEKGVKKEYENARSEYTELKDIVLGDGRMGDVGLKDGLRLYAISRKVAPERIIETGVANGISSLFILAALDENQTGTLYSIDYPFAESLDSGEIKALGAGVGDDILDQYNDADLEGRLSNLPMVIPNGKAPGWAVPTQWRDRWELTLGRSQRELPRIVSSFDSIDIFIHDSDHRQPCQMFEYEIAWEWLRSEGLLISHDVANAWEVFTEVRDPHTEEAVSTAMRYCIKR